MRGVLSDHIRQGYENQSGGVQLDYFHFNACCMLQYSTNQVARSTSSILSNTATVLRNTYLGWAALPRSSSSKSPLLRTRIPGKYVKNWRYVISLHSFFIILPNNKIHSFFLTVTYSNKLPLVPRSLTFTMEALFDVAMAGSNCSFL